eukprot:PhM_4_TR3153/c0_g1_i1/m.14686
MNVDLSTNLQTHTLPKPLATTFPELTNAIVHWYGPIDKHKNNDKNVNSNRPAQPRMMFVTSQSVYVCLPQGGVTRCVDIDELGEMHLLEGGRVSLHFPPPQHDLTFSAPTTDALETILYVLRRIYFTRHGQEVVVRNLVSNQKATPSAAVTASTALAASYTTPTSTRASHDDVGNILAVQQESLHVKYRDAMCDMVKDVSQLVQNLQARDAVIDDQKKQMLRLREEVARLHGSDDVIERMKSELGEAQQEIESQREVIRHMQSQRVSAGYRDYTAEVHVLRAELEEARAQIQTLRAATVDATVLEKLQTDLRIDRACLEDVQSQLRVKDNELAETHSVVARLRAEADEKDAKHALEIQRIRAQFREYDTRIMGFVNKAFDASSPTRVSSSPSSSHAPSSLVEDRGTNNTLFRPVHRNEQQPQQQPPQQQPETITRSPSGCSKKSVGNGDTTTAAAAAAAAAVPAAAPPPTFVPTRPRMVTTSDFVSGGDTQQQQQQESHNSARQSLSLEMDDDEDRRAVSASTAPAYSLPASSSSCRMLQRLTEQQQQQQSVSRQHHHHQKSNDNSITGSTKSGALPSHGIMMMNVAGGPAMGANPGYMSMPTASASSSSTTTSMARSRDRSIL